MNSHEQGRKTKYWIVIHDTNNTHPALWMRQWSLILGSLVTLFESIIMLFFCDCYIFNNSQSGGKTRPVTPCNPKLYKKKKKSQIPQHRTNALGCVQLGAESALYCRITHSWKKKGKKIIIKKNDWELWLGTKRRSELSVSLSVPSSPSFSWASQTQSRLCPHC